MSQTSELELQLVKYQTHIFCSLNFLDKLRKQKSLERSSQPNSRMESKLLDLLLT